MTDELDSLLNDIQQKCDDAALDMFGEETTRRWHNPTYAKIMDTPDSIGEMRGTCGDTIKIFLKINEGIITEASFFTTGCGPSIVSGDIACEISLGKSVDEASEIDGEEILAALGGLPDDKTHCAHLASSALQDALGNWMGNK